MPVEPRARAGRGPRGGGARTARGGGGRGRPRGRGRGGRRGRRPKGRRGGAFGGGRARGRPPEPAPRRRSPPACSTSSPTAAASCACDPAEQSRDDVYVSPAQIRRCELRAGDEVSGPVPPAAAQRAPSVAVHVETVNGARRRAAGGAPLVRRPHPGLPLGAADRARGASTAPPSGAARAWRSPDRPEPAPRPCCASWRRTLAETGRPRRAGRARRRPAGGGRRVARGRRRGGGRRQLRPLRPTPRPRPRSWPSSAPSAASSGAAMPRWSSTRSIRCPAGAQRRCSAPARATEEGGTLTVIAATGEARTRPCAGPPPGSCSSPGGTARARPRAGRCAVRRSSGSDARLLHDERLRHRGRVDQADELVGALHLRRDACRCRPCGPSRSTRTRAARWPRSRCAGAGRRTTR